MNYYRPKSKSALFFILKSLIPYSRENMMLSFKPAHFFNELERTSTHKRRTLENALTEAQRRNLVHREANLIKLTETGIKTVKPFIAKRLPSSVKFMVIFDIPEEKAVARARLRRILREWNFEKVQQSVWVTSYNHIVSVKELVAELEIEPYVVLFECTEL